MSETSKNFLTGSGAMLLPTMTVLLFYFLHLRLNASTPTAGGLAFLASALVAYFFFPKLRVRLSLLALAFALAAVAAALIGMLTGR